MTVHDLLPTRPAHRILLDRLGDAAGRAARRVRHWWYWNATKEGAYRIRERNALDCVLAACEPAWRDAVERYVVRNLERPESWLDVPARWRAKPLGTGRRGER